MPERKLNVFLCHAKEDKPTVRELYRKLVAEGWMDVWLDEENLFPGQEWDMEIEKAVEQADVVLVCLSTYSVDKEGYVQKELRFVLNIADEKPEGTLFVIPLRLDECVVPRRLRSWQYAEYHPKEERARAYERLLVSLRMRAMRLDISTVNPAEEQARKDAEEKARKEKEEQERKTAEERARLLAERKANKERIAREKKDADAKAKKELEKKRMERPADSPAGVAVGGDVKGSLIITGDHNVIVQNAPPIVERDNISPKPEAPKASAPAHATPRQNGKPAFKFEARYLLIIGGLFVISVCGFGINYLIQNWPASPAPTQTSEVPTASSTFSVAPPTELPIETPTPTMTPEPGVGSTQTSPKDGMVMVFVPRGKFAMGSNSGSSDEQPVHDVDLAGFWIDKTEVTNAMYAKCVEAGKCNPLSSNGSSTRKSYYGNSEFNDYPVINVSWNDAKAYCEWRGDGTRLPTEAEWEKAASWDADKQKKSVYPWGNNAPNTDLLNYNGNIGDTTKVGNYPSGASYYGLLDMAGNVWEWVSSLYQSYPYSPDDGRENLSASGSRVLRGGSWNLNFNFVCSADRVGYDPSLTVDGIGFRCSRSP